MQTKPKAPGATAPGQDPADPEAASRRNPSGLIGVGAAMVWLERALGLLPALILFAMMALTFVSVVLRYVFRQPISGAFELMSYAMGLLVFLSLVLVAARAEHVRISVLDGFLPLWLRRLRAVFVNLLMAALAGGLGWRLWFYGERLSRWGDKTQMYHLPNGLLAQIMAISCLISAALFVVLALAVILRRDMLQRVEA